MPPRFHRPARLLVAGSVLVAFLGLFTGGQELLGWDDKTNIVDNDGYKGLDGAHLAWMLKAAHLAVYEPFAWLLKAVEHAAFGPSARGFHLVTLALHVASTLAVLDLARRLLGRAWASAEPAEVETGAVFAALLFGVHPLRVEVVAWASGQSYALAGLFFLLSLSAYLRHVETGRRRWLAGALAAYVAAGLCKSASAMLPLVLVVLDVGPLRRRLGRRVVIEKVPFFAALVGLLAVATRANEGGDIDNVVTLELGERVARAAQALVFYVGKTLWPAGLSPIYPVERERLALLSPETLLAGAALALALLVAVRARRSAPWMGALLAGTVAVLLPVLGLVQHGAVSMAFDRYTYLGMLGLDVVLGAGLARLWHGAGGTATRRAVVAGGVLLAGLTAAEVRVWRTTETLWRHAIAVAPEDALAHNNLGFHLMAEERWAEAAPILARSVALEPRDPRAALNYGVTVEHLGQLDEALAFYASALRTLPNVAEIHFNRGAVLSRQGRLREAREAYERAAGLSPAWRLPRERLARLPR
jgi:tetratricopeptide (TPR) repeat protein